MLKIKKIGAIVCVALVTLLQLTGCGQTGPLYLPGKAALSNVSTSAHAPAASHVTLHNS
ncbi:MAG: LPS translocon maturation chaperone LptM [Rhodoferax sp.]